jgi:hypothetical protein
MGYDRVIPRDLFNEADLLKCIGRLYLELENLYKIYDPKYVAEVLQVDQGPFLIEQNPTDGSIYVKNVDLFFKGNTYKIYRPLNTKIPYNVFLERIREEDIPIFDVNGDLTEEFRGFLRA